MACKNNRKSAFAVGIGINLAMAAVLIGIALGGKMNDASFIAVMGGVFAANIALISSQGSRRCSCRVREAAVPVDE